MCGKSYKYVYLPFVECPHGRGRAQLSEFGPPNEGADDAMMVKVCGQNAFEVQARSLANVIASAHTTEGKVQEGKFESEDENSVTKKCHLKNLGG